MNFIEFVIFITGFIAIKMLYLFALVVDFKRQLLHAGHKSVSLLSVNKRGILALNLEKVHR